VSAGLEPEHRAFHPHITLARYKRHEGSLARQFEQRAADLTSDPFPVDRFTLFQSHLSRHGAYYESIASFPPR
jgi:2'-5' RNA ligase